MKTRNLLSSCLILGALMHTPAQAGIIVMLTTMSSQSSAISSQRLRESSSRVSHSSSSTNNSHSYQEDDAEVETDKQPEITEQSERPSLTSDEIQRELVNKMLFAKREMAEKSRQTSYSPSIERVIGLYEASLDTVNCNRLLVLAFNEALVETRNEANRLDIVDYISDVIRKDGCLN